MKKNLKSKTIYSNSINGVNTKIECKYNSKTDHRGIYTSFQKVDRNNGSKTNKESSQYLGITIAEKVLSKVFKNVNVMPPNNHGYDFICNKGKKIDVKSSIIRKNRKNWTFNINYNKIPNFFLCLGFDNRKDLNPIHIWLIPGDKLNYLSHTCISLSKLERWSKYELGNKLNEVISQCNIIRGE